MSLVAHAGAGVINTWGFAYAGGVIGLFSVSLLYVKARVESGATGSTRTLGRRIAAIGPMAIVVGGACGASFGLGLARVVDRQFFDTAEVDIVVDDLCAVRFDRTVRDGSSLHDDIGHVIRDLDAAPAERAHLALHAAARSSTTTEQQWNDSIDALVEALGRADGSDVGCGDSGPG